MKQTSVVMAGLMAFALDLLPTAAAFAQTNNPQEARPSLNLDPIPGAPAGGLLRSNLTGIGLMQRRSPRVGEKKPKKPPLHRVLMAFVRPAPVGEIGPFRIQIELAVK